MAQKETFWKVHSDVFLIEQTIVKESNWIIMWFTPIEARRLFYFYNGTPPPDIRYKQSRLRLRSRLRSRTEFTEIYATVETPVLW